MPARRERKPREQRQRPARRDHQPRSVQLALQLAQQADAEHVPIVTRTRPAVHGLTAALTVARRSRRTIPATTDRTKEAEMNGYQLEGSLLEACSCSVLCPCWIGEDPDHGTCDSFNAYHFERGTIGGVDVTGLSAVTVNLIPGNVLTPGSWTQVLLIDERASDEQLDAIREAFQGRRGGPLAD